MCLAIVSPQASYIPYSHLQEGYLSNPHGAGFAYAVNGRVVVRKGFFKFSDFWNAFKKINGRFPCMVHFRWATHGAQNQQNCHPFQIDDQHAMIHNGVLSHYTKFHNGMSDTANFTRTFLKPMFERDNTLWNTEFANNIISQAIGDGNKIAIMGKDGTAVIYNEHFGNWTDGVWYSNYDYIKPKKKKKATPVTVS